MKSPASCEDIASRTEWDVCLGLRCSGEQVALQMSQCRSKCKCSKYALVPVSNAAVMHLHAMGRHPLIGLPQAHAEMQLRQVAACSQCSQVWRSAVALPTEQLQPCGSCRRDRQDVDPDIVQRQGSQTGEGLEASWQLLLHLQCTR